jgi:hypothetical protein
MSEHETEQTKLEDISEVETIRKPYVKPQVLELGDMRTTTIGPTPGIGESGSPGTLLA